MRSKLTKAKQFLGPLSGEGLSAVLTSASIWSKVGIFWIDWDNVSFLLPSKISWSQRDVKDANDARIRLSRAEVQVL